MYWMYSMCMTPTYTPASDATDSPRRPPASASARPICSSSRRPCGSITADSLADSLQTQCKVFALHVLNDKGASSQPQQNASKERHQAKACSCQAP